MANGLKQSTETFSSSIEKEFKISELKDKFDIHVSEADLQKYKETVFSMKEIQKIQEGFSSVSELAKTKLDILKTNYENSEAVKKSQEYLKQTLKSGKEAASKSADSAEKLFDSSIEAIGKTEIGKDTKEVIVKAKEEVKKMGFAALVEKWKKSDNFLLKMLGSLFGFFTGLFGFGSKVEDLKEKAKEKLSAEEIDKTKTGIKKVSSEFISQFNEKTEDKILPETQVKLAQLIEQPNFFTEAELKLILEKIESGEFKLSDLKGINKDKYKEVTTLLFSTEQVEYLKNIYTNQAMEAIVTEYAIDLKNLKKEERENLRSLFMDNGIDQDFIKLSEEYEAGKFISFAELIQTGFLAVPHAINFTWKLFNIIPFENLSYHIAKGTTDLLELSTGNDLDVKNLILEKLSGLSEEQKDVVFGIMLRKGMFVFNLIEKITYSSTRMIAESIVGGNKGNSISNMKTFGLNKFSEQSKLFDQMLTSLGKGEAKVGKILQFRIDSLITATNNTKEISQIMQIIEEGGDIKKGLAKLNNNKIAGEILKKEGDIKKLLGIKIEEIHSNLGKNVHGVFENIGENKFGFSKQSELYKLVKGQENTLKVFGKEWNRYLNNGTGGNLRFWEKYNSVKESLRFTQENKNIEIHATSLSEGAQKIDHLKALINESPRLASGLIGAFTLSLVINGVANKNDTESFLEKMKDIGPYVIPTVGPIKVLFYDQGIQKADTIRDSIKYGSETLAMGIFLGMDVAYIGHELVKSFSGGQEWIKAGKNIAGYHLQIIKGPLYDLPIATKNMAVHLSKMKIAPGNIDFKNLSKDKIKLITEKIKNLKLKPKNTVTGILWVAAISGIALSVFMDSTEEKYTKELEENGFIKNGDWNFEKIRNSMSDEEKSIILKDMFWGGIKGLDVKIIGDKLKIISNNEHIQHKSSLIASNLDLLENLGIDTINGKSITFEYNKKPA